MALTHNPAQTARAQTMQRVKVGLIGLCSVILLIALASLILGSAQREAPLAAIDAPKADVVANMTLSNQMGELNGEPLAELGVAPSTSNGQAPAPAK